MKNFTKSEKQFMMRKCRLKFYKDIAWMDDVKLTKSNFKLINDMKTKTGWFREIVKYKYNISMSKVTEESKKMPRRIW